MKIIYRVKETWLGVWFRLWSMDCKTQTPANEILPQKSFQTKIRRFRPFFQFSQFRDARPFLEPQPQPSFFWCWSHFNQISGRFGIFLFLVQGRVPLGNPSPTVNFLDAEIVLIKNPEFSAIFLNYRKLGTRVPFWNPSPKRVFLMLKSF